MSGRPRTGRARAKGNIETLRSGALRVRVYAGVDPVTGRRHNLTKTVEPGPKAWREAEGIRNRLVAEVAEKRNPRTTATVDQLLERYLSQFDGSPNTLRLYRGYVRNHVSPFLGKLKVGDLDADILDSFYAELRRCRVHCSGKRSTQHRVKGEHECDHRCGPHKCCPLGASTVRHIHFILSGAYRKAVRWRWVAVSPVGQAEPPTAPKPNPRPPTPAQAAQIINEAWSDPDWGTLLWTATTTGARRGELAALQLLDLDLTEGRESVWLRRAIRKSEDGTLEEAELKTHQQRRIALDPKTALLLRKLRDRWEARLALLGLELRPRTYLFSGAPDGGTFARPDGITQRYERLADRLDIETTFHKLRHYTATELIVAGVDVRTVAGRLGHGGGGTTTLRIYSAWVSEADQRAATGIGSAMPTRPPEVDKTERRQTQPRHPYERVAAEIRRQVLDGELEAGERLPPEQQLIADHGVSVSTIRRATSLLREWGVLSHTGRKIAIPPQVAPVDIDASIANSDSGAQAQYWSVTLRGPDGHRYPPRLVRARLTDPDSFRPHLIGIARLEVRGCARSRTDWIGNYELEVRTTGSGAASRAILTLRWNA